MFSGNDSGCLPVVPAPAPYEVGQIVYGSYKVKEYVKNCAHNIYKAKSDQPLKDDEGVEYPELMFKVVTDRCAPGQDVLREALVHSWIKSHRCAERLNHILAPTSFVFSPMEKMLAFPMLHCSLNHIKNTLGFLPQRTTLKLGMEMLTAIRELHGLGMVHQNIHPGHFLLPNGIDVTADNFGVVLCDLSLAKPWVIFEEDCPLQLEIPQRPVLDEYYCSVDAMDGNVASRRDDLYSFFYSMISLRAKLPWESVESDNAAVIRIRKADWNRKPVMMASYFCLDLHRLISDIFSWIRNIEPRQKPPYAKMALNLEKAVTILDGKEAGAVEESQLPPEFTRPDSLDAPSKCPFNDDEYKESYNDYKYDVQFLFNRAEAFLTAEVRSGLKEHFKPYVLADDEGTKTAKPKPITVPPRKHRERALKAKEKKMIAKERAKEQQKGHANVAKHSESTDFEEVSEFADHGKHKKAMTPGQKKGDKKQWDKKNHPPPKIHPSPLKIPVKKSDKEVRKDNGIDDRKLFPDPFCSSKKDSKRKKPSKNQLSRKEKKISLARRKDK